MLARQEFELMALQLRGTRGQLILSLSDHPEVRRILAGFDFREEDVRWTLSGNGAGNAKLAKEVIFSGGFETG